MSLYFDTSALVKLVQREPESDALRAYLRRHADEPGVTSALARVELVRAVLAGGPRAVSAARRRLAALHEVALDRTVLDDAATLAPRTRLRSLDAIHLASARLLGAGLRALVTYDERMAASATDAGLPVRAPR
jgi:predicted nucleic acid-binding protein